MFQSQFQKIFNLILEAEFLNNPFKNFQFNNGKVQQLNIKKYKEKCQEKLFSGNIINNLQLNIIDDETIAEVNVTEHFLESFDEQTKIFHGFNHIELTKDQLYEILNKIIPLTLHDININPKFLKTNLFKKYYNFRCSTVFKNNMTNTKFLIVFELNKTNIDNIIIQLITVYPVNSTYDLKNKQYIKINDHNQKFYQYVPHIESSKLICEDINICNIFWQIV